VLKQDDQIDQEFDGLLRKLITYMMEDPRTISASIDLVFVAKAIERVGDHAKNIAETIIYIVKGTDVRHTSDRRWTCRRAPPGGPGERVGRMIATRAGRRGRVGDRRTDRHQPAPRRLPRCDRGEAAARRRSMLDAVLPDLILLDWMLPGESGMQPAGQALARRRRARELPIIMLTARAEEPTRSRAWTPAPTTTSPSRSPPRNCWRASVPCCAARPPSTLDEDRRDWPGLRLDPATRRVSRA
jgi:CheY-like chemotaxis protein